MRHVIAACALGLTCAYGALAQGTDPDLFDIAQPATTQLASKQLWATYYHIWQANEVASGTKLVSMTGVPISAGLTRRDWCMSAIEGTVQVKDAGGNISTFNFAGIAQPAVIDCAKVLGISPRKARWIKATGKSRFRETYGPYGDGVKDYQLVPFRTIAVDKSFIPYGTVVYIPAARGVAIPMPQGGTALHDGYFFAADTGGAIKRNHIDVFIGTNRNNLFPDFVKSTSSQTFEAFIVTDPSVTERLRREHLRPAQRR